MSSINSVLKNVRLLTLGIAVASFPFAASAQSVSGQYQLGGTFPINLSSPLGVSYSNQTINTDSVGNLITQSVSLDASYGVLKASAQAIVQTGSLNMAGSGYASSGVSFNDVITVTSPVLPVGTPVQLALNLNVIGVLQASGTSYFQVGNNDYAFANVGASIGYGWLQPSPPFTVTGPTSTQGLIIPANSETYPNSILDIVNAEVGTVFSVTVTLNTKAFANTFGGAICCQLPQYITPTYPTSNSVSDYSDTAIFTIASLTTDASFSSASGTTYSLVATPLPATLPLFATGLGVLGLLGWRRKQKQNTSLNARVGY